MQVAPKPPNEIERLAFLHALEILDTTPEDRFDSITRLARNTLGANYSAVALVDDERQWFKSQCGLDVNSTSRDVSFCAHTILEDRTLVVEDALLDARFHDNPLVTSEPNLRSYMGHPLVVSGVVLGALCVLYTEPRTFSSQDKETLSDLARMVEEMITFRQFREKAEQGLGELVSESEVIFKKLIQKSSEPTMLIDLIDGTVSDFNVPCAELLGIQVGQGIGKLPPVKPEITTEARAQIISTLERDHKIQNFELGLIARNNERIQLLCSAEVVYRAGRKNLLISGRNVSSLCGRESLFHSALNATVGLIGTGYFEACAEVIASELGVRYGLVLKISEAKSHPSEVLGFWDRDGINSPSPDRDILPFDLDSEKKPIHILKGARERYPDCALLDDLKIESFYRHPIMSSDGDLYGFLVVMDTVPFNDKTERATLLLGILAARTSTEMERQEMNRDLEREKLRSEMASRAKSTFLANMSHELRTPMNAIVGFSQLMARDPDLSMEHRETLKIVNQSGEHLLGLINDVLEMSAIEAGRTNINPVKTELKPYVQSIIMLLSEKARENGLSLSAAVAPDLPDFVQLEQGKVRQILINLIGNAIKFTSEGYVALLITMENWDSPENGPAQLCFEIRDTGVGIAEHALHKLFQPFEQIDRKEGLEGTGLGLSICKSHTEAMGGTISVTSTLGVGSSFHVSIPLLTGVFPEKPALPQTAPIHRSTPVAASDTRILIVDDIDPGRILLRKLLGPLGVQIREAENGKEAIAVEEEWKPHLIFMDLRMPVMDGEQACKLIRQRRGDSAPIIIAITASVFRKNLISPESPFDEVVNKPFRVDDVLQMVRSHMNCSKPFPSTC